MPSLKTLLFGKPIATQDDANERVGPLAAVPILGLDALASAAYGPEALLTVLLPLGLAAHRYVLMLTGLTVALLLLLFISYRRLIDAFPDGGGAYTVSKVHLGEVPSLLAAAALMLDYVLNVAVAISAGVGAIVSVVPRLLPYTLPLTLTLLCLLTLINLRGVREAGLAFALPTFLFIGSLLSIIALGAAKLWLHGHVTALAPVHLAPALVPRASIWLLCRAFASGCTAMTGVEAVSNGIPIFREPRSVAAKRTLTLVIGVLAVLLIGIAFLARAYGITATAPGKQGYESVLSQLVGAVVGHGPAYYVTLATIWAVLALSANTSFAGFPRLCALLAADGFLPEPLMHRGRRLALSHGIITCSLLSGALLVAFGGITDALIPLFAIGALLAFTMSQTGLIAHLWHQGGSRWSRLSISIGALATASAALLVLVTKFSEGAWLTLLGIGLVVLLLRSVKRHYDFVERATAAPQAVQFPPTARVVAVVPVRRWNAITLKGLDFARKLTRDVIVVQIVTGERGLDDLSSVWTSLSNQYAPAEDRDAFLPRLVTLRSVYRDLFQPLLRFLEELAAEDRERQIAVVIPELVEHRWYQFFLHGQSASVLKTLLFFRGVPQLVVVSVPWYLRDWVPERRRLRARTR